MRRITLSALLLAVLLAGCGATTKTVTTTAVTIAPATSAATPRPAPPSAPSFAERLDADAEILDGNIQEALDGTSPPSGVKYIRDRILRRINAQLTRGEDVPVAANLILSAATSAAIAARDGNRDEMNRQRDELADARRALAAGG